MKEFHFCFPDDWHIHLRDDDKLSLTVPDVASYAKRAVVMPNLKTPVTTVAAARAYESRIRAHIPENSDFRPLMTLYLTDHTTPDCIFEAKKAAMIGCKLYPAGATTHSEAGVTKLSKLYEVFAAMSEVGLPLLIHGEVTDESVDIFDRESVFIEQILKPLIHQFPKLKVVLEHISTQKAVEFVAGAPAQVAATITAHHLLFNRNSLLAGGLKPHYYCAPLLKRASDQQALIWAAISGNPKFFLGTDSAPHTQNLKESACACAGIYTAHAAIPLYLSVFEQANALEQFEGFASFYGPDFYELARNKEEMIVAKKPWLVPEYLEFGVDQQKLIPLKAGQSLEWGIV